MMSFVGAIAICDMVKTTLGPKGMDKILVSVSAHDKSISVTNDGATILKSVHVDNAAAKVLIDIAKTQDDEVGDGTTSVAVLCGELLREAEALINARIHPQAGRPRPLPPPLPARTQHAFLAPPAGRPQRFRADLLAIAKTTLSSKILTPRQGPRRRAGRGRRAAPEGQRPARKASAGTRPPGDQEARGLAAGLLPGERVRAGQAHRRGAAQARGERPRAGGQHLHGRGQDQDLRLARARRLHPEGGGHRGGGARQDAPQVPEDHRPRGERVHQPAADLQLPRADLHGRGHGLHRARGLRGHRAPGQGAASVLGGDRLDLDHPSWCWAKVRPGGRDPDRRGPPAPVQRVPRRGGLHGGAARGQPARAGRGRAQPARRALRAHPDRQGRPVRARRRVLRGGHGRRGGRRRAPGGRQAAAGHGGLRARAAAAAHHHRRQRRLRLQRDGHPAARRPRRRPRHGRPGHAGGGDRGHERAGHPGVLQEQAAGGCCISFRSSRDDSPR
ncbi:unnamed protein product [Heterosigma akashiwo]